MLYLKIKKYLNDNSINIDSVFDSFEIKDLSDGNGEFINNWDDSKIGISKPTDEYLESLSNDEVELSNLIINKLSDLDIYHFNSEEVRQMTINEYFVLLLTSKGRTLVAEQIQSLELQVKLGIVTEENANFEYFYNGGSVEISLVQLRALYIFMINTVNTNYGVYKAHIHAIKNLSTIEEVEAYDFTADYLKNQNLNIE